MEGYVSNVIEDEAENWLDKRDTSKPFCLVIGHKATHRDWLPDTQDLGMFDKIHFPCRIIFMITMKAVKPRPFRI